jgi:hypothetical protein
MPSVILYPQVDFSNITIQAQETVQEPLKISFQSYDDVLHLIDDLEDGELEKKCSQADLERINHFLAKLATQGILPNEAEEEFVLKNDIQELLQGEDNPYDYVFWLGWGNDYFIAPAVLCGHGEIVLCTSWIKKKWDQTRKFVKKHKKAIIIGAAVVVAAVIVVGVVAAASAGAAAGAAAAGSDKGEKDKSKTKGEQPSASPSTPPDELSPVMPAASEIPILTSVVKEHIFIFKETVEEGSLLQTFSDSKGHEDAALGEKARNLGAVLAHQTLDGISELTSCIPQLLEEIKDIGQRILPESLLHSNDGVEMTPMKNFENLVAAGHEKIDQVFSTDQAGHHTAEAKEARNNFVIGIIPFSGVFSGGAFNASKLLEAGKAVDRAGFTRAGRGLIKHGYRKGSVFPKPVGNPAQINEHGQKVLESILNHPEKKLMSGEFERFGKVVDIYAPGIGGARYTVEGEFIGFLEP